MAKTTFTHSCGHAGVFVGRNRRDADYRAGKLALEPCWECQKAAITARAVEAAAAEGLPALQGQSDKQVAYATSVRKQVLDQFLSERFQDNVRHGALATVQMTYVDPAELTIATDELRDAVALIEQEMRSETSAKWWLDEGKSLTAESLVKTMVRRGLLPTAAMARTRQSEEGI